ATFGSVAVSPRAALQREMATAPRGNTTAALWSIKTRFDSLHLVTPDEWPQNVRRTRGCASADPHTQLQQCQPTLLPAPPGQQRQANQCRNHQPAQALHVRPPPRCPPARSDVPPAARESASSTPRPSG